MDIKREIRRAVDTGKTVIGFRECEKNVLKGNGKLLILSATLEDKKKEKIKHAAELSGIPCFDFGERSLELGAVCGKPFPISAMLIMDTGKSKVLAVTKQGS